MQESAASGEAGKDLGPVGDPSVREGGGASPPPRSDPSETSGPKQVQGPNGTSENPDEIMSTCDCGWKKPYQTELAAKNGLKMHQTSGHCKNRPRAGKLQPPAKDAGTGDEPGDGSEGGAEGGAKKRVSKTGGKDSKPLGGKKVVEETWRPYGECEEDKRFLETAKNLNVDQRNWKPMLEKWHLGDITDPANTVYILRRWKMVEHKIQIFVELLHGRDAIQGMPRVTDSVDPNAEEVRQMDRDLVFQRKMWQLKMYGGGGGGAQGQGGDQGSRRKRIVKDPLTGTMNEAYMTDQEYTEYLKIGAMTAAQGQAQGQSSSDAYLKMMTETMNLRTKLEEQHWANHEKSVSDKMKRVESRLYNDDFELYKDLKNKASRAGLSRSSTEDHMFQVQMAKFERSNQVMMHALQGFTEKSNHLIGLATPIAQAIGSKIARSVEGDNRPQIPDYSSRELQDYGRRLANPQIRRQMYQRQQQPPRPLQQRQNTRQAPPQAPPQRRPPIYNVRPMSEEEAKSDDRDESEDEE